MKKLLLSAALLVCVYATSAQSRFYLEGSIGISRSEYKPGDILSDQTATNYNFAPSINYMVGKNISLGIGFLYSYQKDNSSYHRQLEGYNYVKGNVTYRINEAGFIPNLTYFQKITDWFYYTPRYYIGYSHLTMKYNHVFWEGNNDPAAISIPPVAEFEKSRQTGNSFFTGLDLLSFEFRVNSHWGLNVSCGDFSYNYMKFKKGEQDRRAVKNTTWNFHLNDNYKLQFRYYF